MTNLKKLREDGWKQLSRGAALCGVPIVSFSSGSFTGSSTIDSVVPLIVLLGAFLMAGVWMFRRWGSSPEAQDTFEHSPGVATSTNEDQKPANA